MKNNTGPGKRIAFFWQSRMFIPLLVVTYGALTRDLCNHRSRTRRDRTDLRCFLCEQTQREHGLRVRAARGEQKRLAIADAVGKQPEIP